MYSILGLAVLVLDIYAIVDCIKRGMSTGKTVLWILLILLLPVVGMALYFLVGRK